MKVVLIKATQKNIVLGGVNMSKEEFISSLTHYENTKITELKKENLRLINLIKEYLSLEANKDDLAHEVDYKKCDNCGDYVPEDYIEILEGMDEMVCEQCITDGYGK
jgi:formylmethanofuran dehydrogenase subunit E